MRKSTVVILAALLVGLVLVSVALAGSRSKAWLGVSAQEVDRQIAREFDLKEAGGAIIDDVVRNSPADKADLREDDIVIAFNSEKVRDEYDLIDLIEDSRPGDTAVLTIIRDGAEKKITVELGRQKNHQDWSGSWSWTDGPVVVPPVPAVPSVPKIRGFSSGPGYLFSHGEDDPYIGVLLLELSDEAAQALGASRGAS